MSLQPNSSPREVLSRLPIPLRQSGSPRRPHNGVSSSENPPAKRVRLILRPPRRPVRLFLRPPAPPESSIVSAVASTPLQSPLDSSITNSVSPVSSAFHSPISPNRNNLELENSDIWEEMLLNEAEAGQNNNLDRGSVRSSPEHLSSSVTSSRAVSPPANHPELRENRETRRRTVTARRRAAAHRDFPAAFKSQYTLESAIRRIQHMTDHCRHCGAWHWEAEAVRSSSNRVYETCCKRGDVVLPPFQPPPDFLQQLLIGDDTRTRTFRKNLRKYNSALTFTSVNYKPDRRLPRNGRGPICFQIHGELYHLQGPLDPVDDSPRFAQLFFYDPAEATAIRTRQHEELNPDIVRRLTEMLHNLNPFIGLYKTASEALRENSATTDDLRIVLNPQMRLIMEAGADRRRSNLPISDEIAGIIPDEYGEPCKRDIVLTERVAGVTGISLKRIDQNHAAYMPLHYVLLFPHGEHGWDWSMRLRSNARARQRDRLCQRAFYRYRLHTRRNEFSIMHHCQRLFQQYLVDAWASCDLNKLQWLRENQKTIRAELYSGLADSLRRDEVDSAATLGKRFILPSTYTGGDRFMQQLFQDSMALVRHFGRPDLFITFTANPNWSEIKEALKDFPGQTATDRPDIMARAFRLRQSSLLQELKKDNIFGRFRGCVWTIEYQKRGLPHMHLLLFLHPSDRFMDADRIDQIISAELPDPALDTDGSLKEIIIKQMVHGPCGTAMPTAPCMQSDSGSSTCSKRYPRPFQGTTVVEENGYPTYRRRNDGRIWEVPMSGGRVFRCDNRWVVPYNPYLSRKYEAHINVEVCATVKAVKYIHKYIYKGADRATVQIDGFDDEIARHLNGRYIGPTQAAWQLWEYPSHEEFPAVYHLPIHLPNQQSVYFNADADLIDLHNTLNFSRSKLMAFFEYNRLHADGRELLYQDFPNSYVWEAKKKCWQPRQRGFAVGRIYACSPMAGEKYYLRMLLTIVPGPRSFEDLRAVDGVVCSTFQAACSARGLLEDDQEWISCFAEAVRFSSGYALRALFGTALVHGHVTDSTALWIRYANDICDDLPHRLRSMTDVPDDLMTPHLDYGLYLLNEVLSDLGKRLQDYNMPLFTHDWGRSTGNPLIANEMTYDFNEETSLRNERYTQLNADQKHCFDTIVAGVTGHPGSAHFFVHGPAGTGKTFLYKTLCNHFRAENKIVLCVASSGIAALLLPGGQTSHSRFKIPLILNEDSVCNIIRNTHLYGLLQRTALIIWDEVPMQHKQCFMAVHRTFTDLLGNDDLFGGIPMVLGGDFAQILPVVPRGNREAVVAANIQKTFLWSRFQKLFLRSNMRIRNGVANEAFADWIGKMSYDPAFYGRIQLPEQVNQLNNLDGFVDAVFPPDRMRQAHLDAGFFASRAILTLRNDIVADLNDSILNRLQGDSHTLNSVDQIENDTAQERGDFLPLEFLRTLQTSSLPPSQLQLKLGAPVILLRNLYPKLGLCNGTRLRLTHISRTCLEGKILGGELDGETRLIPRILLNTTEGELPWIVSRKQFPIRLCFAMTVNKSQGQSLDTVGVDLRASPFTHGQLYVALSRVTDVSRLCVLFPERGDGKTDNIVYPEVILRPEYEAES